MLEFPRQITPDKRKSVTELMIHKMKNLRKIGKSYREIGERVGVCENTVKRYVQPGYAEKCRKWLRPHNLNRYRKDPKYKQKIKDTMKKRMKERYSSDVELRFYQSCCSTRIDRIKKNWGTLENYKNYFMELDAFKQKTISFDALKIKKAKLKKKYGFKTF